MRVTPNVEQPDGEFIDLNSIGIETQSVLVRRNGVPFGLAFMAGYSPVSLFVDLEQPDGLEFGPVVEIAGTSFPTMRKRRSARVYEFEIQMSITSHWRVAVTHGFDKLDDGDLNLTALEAESQIELITLEGDGLGFAIQGGFEKAVAGAQDRARRRSFRLDR